MPSIYRGLLLPAKVHPYHCTILLLLLPLMLIGGCSSTPKIPATPKPQAVVPAKTDAEKRVSAWKTLIATQQNAPEDRKLFLVNNFINSLQFVDDIEHWGQEDYWATPIETISTNGGDCEDFVIAKYFTLKYMNVPEERMRMTYVKALNLNKAHMVLSYFLTPESEPLVLDNLDPEIKPSSQRTDLLPIYSFNAEGLWLAKKRAAAEYVSDSSRISLWQKLTEKMQREQDGLGNVTRK